MADQTFDDSRRRRMRRNMKLKSEASTSQNQDVSRSTPSRVSFFTTLDKPLVAIVSLLVIIGSMMIFSTTFDWSNASRGSATAIFVEDHLRNVVLSMIALSIFSIVDYRFWKQFAIWLLLITIGALIAVLLFGDDTFGARRSLIGGRFQPGELAEFTIVVYMAAWLGSKNTKVDSFLFGFIPFGIVVGIITYLITQQPDLSSAAVIVMTASIMYFLAGANFLHLAAILGLGGSIGIVLVQGLGYAQTRIADYTAGLIDPTQANYHTQQAIIAFLKGGWTGVGLGQSEQKFGALPAPHTDSIFAIIGEELGVLGASFVVLLFVAFAIRGFQIARNARDPFGALLCIGFTSWVIIQALLNIAVMTALVPSTGVPLPFISFGGSSLMVLMVGVGMMLSVQRIANLRQSTSERRNASANYDRGWGNRRARLSSTSNRRSPLEQR
jgi:cell division protein FtsW